jgi:hypothetical protein
MADQRAATERRGRDGGRDRLDRRWRAEHPKDRGTAFLARCGACQSYATATHASVCVCELAVGDTISCLCGHCSVDADALEERTFTILKEFSSEKACDAAAYPKNTAHWARQRKTRA